MCQTVASESPEHHFARLKYEQAIQEYNNVTEQMMPLKEKAAVLEKAMVAAQCVDPHAEKTLDKKALEAYLTCLAVRTKALQMQAIILDELKQMDQKQKDLDLPALKVRMDRADDCLVVYHTTIDKKVSDLTTREADQIMACKSADLYPPAK
jgi:hypothetical protein